MKNKFLLLLIYLLVNPTLCKKSFSQELFSCQYLSDSILCKYFFSIFCQEGIYIIKDSLFASDSNFSTPSITKVNSEFDIKDENNLIKIKLSSFNPIEVGSEEFSYEVQRKKKRKSNVWILEGYFRFNIKCTENLMQISLLNGIKPKLIFMKEY